MLVALPVAALVAEPDGVIDGVAVEVAVAEADEDALPVGVPVEVATAELEAEAEADALSSCARTPAHSSTTTSAYTAVRGAIFLRATGDL